MVAGDKFSSDYDPENHELEYSSNEGSSDECEDTSQNGREHYQSVEISRLRAVPDIADLGPEYKATKVSRETAFNDSDTDTQFLTDDNENLDHPPNHQSEYTSDSSLSSAYESDGDSHFGSHDESNQITNISSQEHRENELLSNDYSINNKSVEQAQARRLLLQGSREVNAAIVKAKREDILKGQAVKAQVEGYNTLLYLRICLQKALIGMNTLANIRVNIPSDANFTRESTNFARSKAWTLWQALDDLRCAVDFECTGTKRKRFNGHTGSSVTTAWEHMCTLEKSLLSYRQEVLQAWMDKTRDIAGCSLKANPRYLDERVTQSSKSGQSLESVVAAHLYDLDGLVRRSRIPRSCAPAQAESNRGECTEVFDDADFYGALLQNLVEERGGLNNVASITTGINASAKVVDAESLQALRKLRNSCKSKDKVVDRKASRGRKLRFTVHEKLQNFMTCDDRTTWSEARVDELCSNLFGMENNMCQLKKRGVDNIKMALFGTE